MTRQWMAWTRLLMGMFGAKSNQQTFKMDRSSTGHMLVISNAQMTRVNIFWKVVEIAIASNELVFHQLLFWLVKALLRNLGLNGRFVVHFPYVLQLVMQELYTFIPSCRTCPELLSIWMSIGVCCESMNIAYQYVAIKIPIATNITIAMVARKQFLVDYSLKSPSMERRTILMVQVEWINSLQ